MESKHAAYPAHDFCIPCQASRPSPFAVFKSCVCPSQANLSKNGVGVGDDISVGGRAFACFRFACESHPMLPNSKSAFIPISRSAQSAKRPQRLRIGSKSALVCSPLRRACCSHVRTASRRHWNHVLSHSCKPVQRLHRFCPADSCARLGLPLLFASVITVEMGSTVMMAMDCSSAPA